MRCRIGIKKIIASCGEPLRFMFRDNIYFTDSIRESTTMAFMIFGSNNIWIYNYFSLKHNKYIRIINNNIGSEKYFAATGEYCDGYYDDIYLNPDYFKPKHKIRTVLLNIGQPFKILLRWPYDETKYFTNKDLHISMHIDEKGNFINDGLITSPLWIREKCSEDDIWNIAKNSSYLKNHG